jgi:RNA polymerase sigma-70 factor, ECF subfamily
MNDSNLAISPVKPHLAEDEDHDLAVRLAAGEPSALATLVERYRERVATMAARLLGWNDGAEDVMQSVFFAVWRHRQRFRGDAKLWTYLASITVNQCRSLQRRRWLEERVRRLMGANRQVAELSGDSAALSSERAIIVRQAIARMPVTYREVVVLRYLEELSIDEVAKVIGIKRNAVEARLSRARKLLGESLAYLVNE